MKAIVGGDAIPVVPNCAELKTNFPLIPTPPFTTRAPVLTDVDAVEELINTCPTLGLYDKLELTKIFEDPEVAEANVKYLDAFVESDVNVTEPATVAVPAKPALTAVPAEPAVTDVPAEPALVAVPAVPAETEVPAEPALTAVPADPAVTEVPAEPAFVAVPAVPADIEVPALPAVVAVVALPENVVAVIVLPSALTPDKT